MRAVNRYLASKHMNFDVAIYTLSSGGKTFPLNKLITMVNIVVMGETAIAYPRGQQDVHKETDPSYFNTSQMKPVRITSPIMLPFLDFLDQHDSLKTIRFNESRKCTEIFWLNDSHCRCLIMWWLSWSPGNSVDEIMFSAERKHIRMDKRLIGKVPPFETEPITSYLESYSRNTLGKSITKDQAMTTVQFSYEASTGLTVTLFIGAPENGKLHNLTPGDFDQIMKGICASKVRVV